MALGRQRDHTLAKSSYRSRRWKHATSLLLRARSFRAPTNPLNPVIVLRAASSYQHFSDEVQRYYLRKKSIEKSQFPKHFEDLPDSLALILFRFRKKDVLRMVEAINWPDGWGYTRRNRYRCDPLLVTCVILRRICYPSRWVDMEVLFGGHGPQLSEIFWEGMEHFLETRGHLITGLTSESFMESNAERYAQAIHAVGGALDNCVRFIDGTVIGIARPENDEVQNVAYNGHKRKRALKYQAVTAPDGHILHASGPMEGRRHEWTLYMRSGLDEEIESLLTIDGKQYVIDGDSGYNIRVFMEVPFQGSNLNSAQRAFNKAMSKVRVTV